MKAYIVDSFTKEPFKGNPAGVCLLENEISEEKMLNIAREFGFSETAFVNETGKSGMYKIRFFSPRKEIPLCGHATLASAKILFEKGNNKEIHFITVENIDLSIRHEAGEILMEFPIYETTSADVPLAMLDALGIKRVRNSAYSAKNKIILLEIEDTGLLAALRPDFSALLRSYQDINGVLVTAPSADKEYDFHYRYFWPWAGTNEDPVTGGVQTFLAKYWSARTGKKIMKAFQSSARTGFMTVELFEEKVIVKGRAVILMEGNLYV